MIDSTQNSRTRVRVAPVDPALPLGLCQPQLGGDTGFDLLAAADALIPPMASVDVPVNAKIELPPGFYADVRNRSSMARRGLYVDHNLIDNGYRGPLFVMVRNLTLPAMRALSDEEVSRHVPDTGIAVPGRGLRVYRGPNVAAMDPDKDPGTAVIRAGERVAQLAFMRGCPVWTDEVDGIDESTERGSRGFGSTGL